MSVETFTTKLGETELTIEYGRMAEQADAAVTVRAGDTVVLATAVTSKNEREGIDFFPLMVEYEERMYAAGKISGSRFLKREGRPSENAILTARLVDRSIRPLFDKEFRKDVQIVLTVLSYDKEHDPDIIALVAASCALMRSGTAPFSGPVSAVRIGMIDGKLIVQPTHSQMAESDLDLVVAGTKDRVMMVEAGANEVPEKVMLEALRLAHKEMQASIEIQKKFARVYEPVVLLQDVVPAIDEVKKVALTGIKEAFTHKDREARRQKLEDLEAEILLKFEGIYKQIEIKAAFTKLVDYEIRSAVLERQERPDGRGITEIRPLSIETGLLPRTHGSALFTRGQTQALTVATLASPGFEQTIETMDQDTTKRYMHHYNFPAFSTGEAAPVRSTSRREIGHGALAESALLPVLPSKEEFPYTIRLVSEILSSNGSSSMASTCGSTLALLDAGVPITKPVAGIAMGLMTNPDASKFEVLTDLQGLEDFAGDMDFKIAGTKDGITAIQMDTKIAGLTWPIIEQTLSQAYEGRLFILDVMNKAISKPKELSKYAPRITSVKIDPSKIGELIGPGGKNINGLIDMAGGKEVTSIDIEEDGTVLISSSDAQLAEQVIDTIRAIGKVIEVGEVYEGEVVAIVKDRMNPNKEIGAIVEFLPGKDGMVHISQVAHERIEKVSDHLQLGNMVKVKVTAVDPEKGRISLSIKDLLD